MEDHFYEDLAWKLLEINLNRDSLNSSLLKDMFKDKPHILGQINFGEGVDIDNLDKHLYNANPDTVEILTRPAKKNEVYECIPCNRIFKRSDNWQRHCKTGLHERRVARFREAQSC